MGTQGYRAYRETSSDCECEVCSSEGAWSQLRWCQSGSQMGGLGVSLTWLYFGRRVPTVLSKLAWTCCLLRGPVKSGAVLLFPVPAGSVRHRQVKASALWGPGRAEEGAVRPRAAGGRCGHSPLRGAGLPGERRCSRTAPCGGTGGTALPLALGHSRISLALLRLKYKRNLYPLSHSR